MSFCENNINLFQMYLADLEGSASNVLATAGF